MTPHDGLARWIEQLRDRLERGGLAGLGPIDLGDGMTHVPGEQTVRIMLADLADLDDPAGSAAGDPDWRGERRYRLLDAFRRLRALIG